MGGIYRPEGKGRWVRERERERGLLSYKGQLTAGRHEAKEREEREREKVLLSHS